MHELDDSFYDTNTLFVWRIQEFEVMGGLKRMNGGKALCAPMIFPSRCANDLENGNSTSD
jgi:hypothetical protein